MGTSLIQMTLGRLREFRREPSAFFFVLTTPVLLMVTLGFAFDSADEPRYRMGIVGDAEESLNLRLESPLFETPIKLQGGDWRERIKQQDLDAVVETTGDGAPRYHYAPHSARSQAAVLQAMQQNLQQNVQQGGKPQGEAGGSMPAELVPILTSRARYVDFLVPGLVAFSIFFTSLFGLGMTLVAFRRDQIFKRYATTPVSLSQLFASFLISRTMILIAELAVILISSYLIFHYQVKGNFALFLGFVLLGGSTVAALAVLLGARLKNTGAYNGMVNLIAFPTVILSGIYFSRNYLPSWLSRVSEWTPLTAFVDGMRMIANEGRGLEGVWMQGAVLAAYLILFSAAARRTFRWY